MDWTVAREKLNTLRELDARRRQFGASSHEYTLNPCLSEEEVQSFEQYFDLRLPEEYRSFLLQMGNGGAGPFYGIQPLVLPTQTEEPLEPEHPLLRSFPLSTGFLLYDLLEEVFEMEAEEETEKAYQEASVKAFVRAGLNDPALLDDIRKGTVDEYEVVGAGSLPLCHYGCGIMMNLIVRGESEGTIWCSDLGHDVGVYPLSTDHGYDVGFVEPDDEGQLEYGELHRFGSWYEAWLDKSIEECQKVTP